MNNAIKSSVVQTIQAIIGIHNHIINLKVRNKWVIASLNSGVHLWILNK